MFGYFKKKASHNTSSSIAGLKEALERRYSMYAEQYGSKVFNIDAFYERYQKVTSSSTHEIKIFLHSEIEAVDLFVKKIEAKQKEAPSASASSATVEVYRGYLENVEKYPHVPLHEKAFREIEHLCGALIRLYERHLSCLDKIRAKLTRPQEKDLYSDLQGYMQILFPLFGSRKPKLFLEYVTEVKRHQNDEDNIEIAGHKILKQTFHMVQAMKRLLDHLKQDADKKYASTIFVIDRKPYKFWEYEASLRQELNQLLKDFRLTGLL